MNGRHWGDKELKRLQALADRGLSISKAAHRLHRTPAAVAIKASALGVKFHGGPGGAPKGNKNGRRKVSHA